MKRATCPTGQLCQTPERCTLLNCALLNEANEPDQRNYFVIKDGKRTARCYGRYNGGKPAAEAACKPGEAVSEGRCCPYPGRPCGPDARPPCALCYE